MSANSGNNASRALPQRHEKIPNPYFMYLAKYMFVKYVRYARLDPIATFFHEAGYVFDGVNESIVAFHDVNETSDEEDDSDDPKLQ